MLRLGPNAVGGKISLARHKILQRHLCRLQLGIELEVRHGSDLGQFLGQFGFLTVNVLVSLIQYFNRLRSGQAVLLAEPAFGLHLLGILHVRGKLGGFFARDHGPADRRLLQKVLDRLLFDPGRGDRCGQGEFPDAFQLLLFLQHGAGIERIAVGIEAAQIGDHFIPFDLCRIIKLIPRHRSFYPSPCSLMRKIPFSLKRLIMLLVQLRKPVLKDRYLRIQVRPLLRLIFRFLRRDILAYRSQDKQRIGHDLIGEPIRHDRCLRFSRHVIPRAPGGSLELALNRDGSGRLILLFRLDLDILRFDHAILQGDTQLEFDPLGHRLKGTIHTHFQDSPLLGLELRARLDRRLTLLVEAYPIRCHRGQFLAVGLKRFVGKGRSAHHLEHLVGAHPVDQTVRSLKTGAYRDMGLALFVEGNRILFFRGKGHLPAGHGDDIAHRFRSAHHLEHLVGAHAVHQTVRPLELGPGGDMGLALLVEGDHVRLLGSERYLSVAYLNRFLYLLRSAHYLEHFLCADLIHQPVRTVEAGAGRDMGIPVLAEGHQVFAYRGQGHLSVRDLDRILGLQGAADHLELSGVPNHIIQAVRPLELGAPLDSRLAVLPKQGISAIRGLGITNRNKLDPVIKGDGIRGGGHPAMHLEFPVLIRDERIPLLIPETGAGRNDRFAVLVIGDLIFAHRLKGSAAFQGERILAGKRSSHHLKGTVCRRFVHEAVIPLETGPGRDILLAVGKGEVIFGKRGQGDVPVDHDIIFHPERTLQGKHPFSEKLIQIHVRAGRDRQLHVLLRLDRQAVLELEGLALFHAEFDRGNA